MIKIFNRYKITMLVALHDLFMTLLALYLTVYLRFDGEDLERARYYLVNYIPFFALYAAIIYALFSLYSAKWRFASLPDLINIAKAVFVLTCSLVIIDYIVVAKNLVGSLIVGKKAVFIYALLQTILLGAPRMVYRYYKTLHMNFKRKEVENLIIIGRASDVEFVSRAIETGMLKGNLLGFISPVEADILIKVRGVRSIGRLSEIETVLAEYKLRGIRIHQAIVTSDIFQGNNEAGNILGSLRRNNVLLKSFSLKDRDKGTAETGQFEKVNDEELILRSLVSIDNASLNVLIKYKTVMITGGGGSIGSEITMQVAKLGAGEIIIVENSEPALYSILERLELAGYSENVKGVLCDIRDIDRLKSVFTTHKPQLVYHAAALKHVPYLEEATIEALKTNALGTMNVANCAKDSDVQAFVLISTDKATNPVSILGATKRLAELYVQMMDSVQSSTRFIAVRFGNVLGTSGSVVPRFAKQIAEGGPVTVTHKDMVRYFMTVKEATSLVLTASSHAIKDKSKLASIYLLNMGQPVRIYELAERMIHMAGFEPNDDIEIKVTGMRPGERLNESLFHGNEPLADVEISGMVAAKKGQLPSLFLQKTLAELQKLAETQDEIAVRVKIHEAIKIAKSKEKFV